MVERGDAADKKLVLPYEHLLLNREAGIAAELIAHGVTLLGRANYAQTGLYGQAFFSLSIGFERTAKLIYIADFVIQNGGRFPSNKELKNKIGHDLDHLFDHAETISIRCRQGKKHWERPRTEIHNAIVSVLTEFARRSRYYNLDAVTSSSPAQPSDPMFAWNEQVIKPIIEKHLSANQRAKIEKNANLIHAMLSEHALVRFTDESGNIMNTVYSASRRSGETDIARKWIPLYILQLARWLTLMLDHLSHEGAYGHQIDALLGLDEHFAIFANEDAYFKSRRTWSIYGR